MWSLAKPSLSMALGDIPTLIAESGGRLKITDQTGLELLYRDYDTAGGNMTQARHDRYDAAKAKIIHSLYPKTYESGTSPLKSIRSELMMMVDKCPYCGFGEPITLDHVKPQSSFKALSTCRLNLVPLCYRCNQYKGTDKHMFVHPYYQRYPINKRFFSASVQFFFGHFIFSFYIDPTYLSPKLSAILANQIQVIRLTQRLAKEVSSFIYEQLKSQCFHDSDQLLKKIISDMVDQSTINNGLNHWKTAALKALETSPDLSIDNIDAYLAKIQSSRQPVI